MSLELLKTIFKSLPASKNWRAHLLSYTFKNASNLYNCRHIRFSDDNRMERLIADISRRQAGEKKNRLDQFSNLREYDGTCDVKTIYKICENDTELDIELDALLDGISLSSEEADPFAVKNNGYILQGELKMDEQLHQIILVSLTNPSTVLKDRFIFKNGKFEEVSTNILHLHTSIDVVIYDRTIYFLGALGEKLFNMERSYKKKCEQSIEVIKNLNMLSDPDVFSQVALKGFNPRKFVTFSQNKLSLLECEEKRFQASEFFNLPLTGDKKFDTSSKEKVDNLIKVLCNKAMWDALEEVPVEVDGSREWLG